MMRKSEKLEKAYISGLMRIEGVEDIPAAYLKFESSCDFKLKTVNFRIIAIRTPIFDISFDNNDVVLVNHTSKEYIKLKMDQLDFSKIIGINFNPLDIAYFFLGCVPYSESMEMVDFKWSKKEYQMVISDNISKYTINLNDKEEILSVLLNNQYLGSLVIAPISYKKDNGENNLPNVLSVKDNEENVRITFRINKSIVDSLNNDLQDINKIIKNYTKITDINKMKIDKSKIFQTKEE
jgi:hypothetical protein